ncbi:MAG: glycosyltransferase family 39 protein [Rhodospirillales bacterium]|nr:glycosyltransferase family 39 protein [Rhodospirillales bacterium]
MNERPTRLTKPALGDAWLIALIWCGLVASALFLRPLLPIDETRYITVAWEMWTNQNFLVPHLNGELYSHKPPLLFWLMKLGWLVFGVSETWARLVAPLFALASLWLTAKLAHELWPQEPASILTNRAVLAPLMMVCGLYWTVFSTMIMFDMMLTAATILAVLGYVKAWKGFVAGKGFWTGLLIAALGLGLGGMAKGPAILVHTLPLALAAPLWGPALTNGRGETTWGNWYADVFASVILGTALVLCWAIPAAIEGGAEYRDAIFIKQSTERMVESFAHRRPFYWFVWVLPLMLLPWTVWPRLWRGIGARQAWREGRGLRPLLGDGAMRVLLVWFGASFVIFSAISGKQPHYLLPVFPALALFAAVMLTQREPSSASPAPALQNDFGHRLPIILLGAIALILLIAGLAKENIEPLLKSPLPDWVGAAQSLWLAPAVLLAGVAAMRKAQGPKAEARLIAVTVVGLMVFLHLAAAPAFSLAYDLEHPAQQIKTFQDAGRPVAYVGKYHGEFQFLGRLEQPIAVLDTMDDGHVWAAAHPQGVIVATLRESDIPANSKPLSIRPYRGRVLVMWDAERF